MMESDKAANEVKMFSPLLPKGGGTIKGMEESMAAPGSDGMAGFSIPLPVTPGRYITPQLSLSYGSGNGNGPFGLGWQMGIPVISRRTSKGIPGYTSQDEFLGPDGEVLVPRWDEQGNVMTRRTDKAQGVPLGETFTVTGYLSRNESSFHLIEYWEALEGSSTAPFWLLHGSDGSLHCFGKHAGARISSPKDPAKIAVWLLEESLSPFGEHVYYEYKQEDNTGVNPQDNHEYSANRYLKYIRYGNKTAYGSLYLWGNEIPSKDQWHYTLVLDYGEDQTPVESPPPFTPQDSWTVRPDSFSRFDYGFEIRTCRLCRQIFLFHNFDQLGSAPLLIWRMRFEYDENPAVSMLSAVWQLGYEDGLMLDMPPLEFGYTGFQPDSLPDWQPFVPTPEMPDGQSYQIVDLYGEGIPGILYQSSGGWQYRRPVRDDKGKEQDSVTYESFTPLSRLPVPSQNGVLIDVDGDGYLEWMVAHPNFLGSYTMDPDETWSHFVPIKALPTEFFHPKAVLNNVTGSRYFDLLMIGPKSVRFYAGGESGFQSAREALQEAGITLPFNGTNEKELVAFSDMLGSGQQHLVRICNEGVTCWPNLGFGVFGVPMEIPGFFIEERDFSPERVSLVDIDGTGTSDLLYALHDRILVYRNLSGNSFAAPWQIPLPDGVHFDNLCRLYPADINGQGVAGLVLSIPYMKPQDWYLSLSEVKPYLLENINNNIGISTLFTYRSSAQFWLDEKKANPSAVCALPFGVNVISGVQTLDENTGNSLVKKYTYRRGVYDRQEKEYRGFGNIQVLEEQQDPHGAVIDRCPAVTTCTWYHTGRKEDEGVAASEYWKGDEEAFSLEAACFTTFDRLSGEDVILDNPSGQQEYWLYRALKGMPLHSEIFPEDKRDNVPYYVESNRYQVRLVQDTDPGYVVLPVQLEQLGCNYEQIASDPQCTQLINQYFDQYGFITQSVGIEYPRREKKDSNLYGDMLPDTSLSSSYDEQQTVLRFTRGREKMYHLTDPENWRLGIGHQTRADVFTYVAESIPEGGIRAELLNQEGLLASDPEEYMYGGQREVVYAGEGAPDLRGLVSYTRTAVYDESSLEAYEGILTDRELSAILTQAGYQQTPYILGTDKEGSIYAVQQGFTFYGEGDTFYRITGGQDSLLTGKKSYTWDDSYCVILSSEDALGNQVQASYDYRFLKPDRITDMNGNVSQVKRDALGRVAYTRMWGREKGVDVGFNSEVDFMPPKTVEEALSLASPMAAASSMAYNTGSWMGSITLEQLSQNTAEGEKYWQELVEEGIILADGRIRVKGRNQFIVDKLPSSVASLLTEAPRFPVHMAVLQADQYPDAPGQQIHKSVVFSDGFGRILQTSLRCEAGMAYGLYENGNLTADTAGRPVEQETDSRWSVTGRVEYDCRGIVMKDYQPFFLNNWKYAGNEAVDRLMYANTYYHDPLGRQTRTVNAKGYETYRGYFPWFTIYEDENDRDATSQCKGTPTITVMNNQNLPIRRLEYNFTGDAREEYITRSTYTLLGHLKSSMDPRLFRTAQTQDKVIPNVTNTSTLLGTVIKTSSVDGGVTAWIPDLESRPLWHINGNEVQTRITYDVLGRPLAVYEEKEGQLCRERFVYGEKEADASANNLLGRLVRHYNTGGLVSMESYSLSGLPLVQERRLPADMDKASDWQTEEESNWAALLDTGRYVTSWEYNGMGQRISQTDAKGNIQRTVYGVFGRMKAASLIIKGQAEQSIVNRMDYNASGQKLTVWLGNGTVTRYAYEESTQRLIGITTGRLVSEGEEEVLEELPYEYDPVGNVILAGSNQAFRYDSLYRLVSSSGRESDANRTDQLFPPVITPVPGEESQYVDYTESYEYDLGGNLTQIRHTGASAYTTNIAVSDRSNRGVWINDRASVDVESCFDKAGNLTQLMPGVPLEWNSRNQLEQVNQAVRDGEENLRESYLYDSLGSRIVKRTIHQASGVVDKATAIYLPGLEIRTKQTNGNVTEALQVITAGEARVLHWEEGTPGDGTGNSQYRYTNTDLIGSFMLELDQDGGLISREEYYPFGGTAIWASRSEVEAGCKTVRYSGKEMDASGLYYYGFRYYMPWSGRWLSADPAGTADGLNLYSMVRNNPVTKSDLYGLMDSCRPGTSGNRSRSRSRSRSPIRSRSRSTGSFVSDVSSISNISSIGDISSEGISRSSSRSSSPIPIPAGSHSYVFHASEEELRTRAINQRQVLQNVYSLDESAVHLVEVRSNQELIDKWNVMGIENGEAVNIQSVVVNLHANPAVLYFFESDESFVNEHYNSLHNKTVGEVLLFGCNAGNYLYYGSNPAYQLAGKVNGAPVLASDGTISSVMGADQVRYMSADDDEYQRWNHYQLNTNKGWLVYQLHNNHINYYQLNLNKLIKFSELIYGLQPFRV